ncbi:hypothetical protein F5B22DRAFT_289132 [Xylaria bambusicola]|uniref:uncharacterized protein n=1 Tax=Xylaria bambusicola TaxID=326684 RepID=UPI0020085EC3|nr:uncharacterized protein F5B22DRAFT_289132 [Xylaria bambusicola]KAI0512910.1 hypothetical protein F5B22DRAFT_289132 [Xylaria bambusicola]
MSPGLRPLRLPLLVERRRKREEEAVTTFCDTTDGDLSSYHYSWQQQQTRQQPPMVTDSTSSGMTSPVTPTFSARGHLRYSSSMSSFDLALPPSCEDLPSPVQAQQTPSKRILDDVEEEEPFEYDRFNHYVSDAHVGYGDCSDQDLYHCLCDEPLCIHRDGDIVRTSTNFYARGRGVEPDFGFLSDGDSPTSQRSSRTKQRNGSLPPLTSLSHRIGSRFPFTRWRSPRKLSAVSSPVSDVGSERRSTSRAPSSRSSSLSRSNRYLADRSIEPVAPPTPALSFFESSDSIILPGPLDVEHADIVLSSIQRERTQATTPLLPPMMTSNFADYGHSQPSPLQSPTIASPVDDEFQSPLILSPPLSTKPSISSFRQMMASDELLSDLAPDSWSDRLGHANFTILPVPYRPVVSTLSSLLELRTDWETARVNYTKHLVRTGEHYGLTSKTYGYTEEKWAEIDRQWRTLHDEVVDAVVASGEAVGCEKFDETIMTTVPVMDGEGKFPERGDEDIVGPMVRELTMTSPTGTERRRPSFWRHLTDRVGLRK